MTLELSLCCVCFLVLAVSFAQLEDKAQANSDSSDWPCAGGRSRLRSPTETEPGSSGEQPCQGTTWRTHRPDEVGSMRAARPSTPPRAVPQPHRTIELYTLNTPAAKTRGNGRLTVRPVHSKRYPYPHNSEGRRVVGPEEGLVVAAMRDKIRNRGGETNLSATRGGDGVSEYLDREQNGAEAISVARLA
jgi:hypothetical protein